jgi:hypothetical protein
MQRQLPLAKRLYRANPKSGARHSLREISAEQAKAGYFMGSQYRNKGKGSGHVHREREKVVHFHATIKAMIRSRRRRSPNHKSGTKRTTYYKDHC